MFGTSGVALLSGVPIRRMKSKPLGQESSVDPEVCVCSNKTSEYIL